MIIKVYALISAVFAVGIICDIAGIIFAPKSVAHFLFDQNIGNIAVVWLFATIIAGVASIIFDSLAEHERGK